MGKKKRISWRKGSGEALGFLSLLPVIFLLIIGIISIVKLTSLRQKMEYTAYVACRAAALSNTKPAAEENARKVAEIELAGYSDIYDVDLLDVKIDAVSKGSFPVSFVSCYDSRSRKTNKTWNKGKFVKCVLTVHLNDSNIFLSGDKTCTIYMALEKEDY